MTPKGAKYIKKAHSVLLRHGPLIFFYWHRPLYRPEQAIDGWNKIWAFFGKYLAK